MEQQRLDAFYTIITEFRDFLSFDVISDETMAPWVDKLKKSAMSFANACKKLDKADVTMLLDSNMGQIYRIHETLVGVYGRTYIPAKFLDKFRTSHDTVLQGVFKISRPTRRFQHMPTKLFNRFVRGITYFHDQPVISEPVYHRNDSCGAATLNYVTKFVTRGAHQLSDDSLERCYIERLVYDAIYTTIFYKQDLGHLRELRNIERLYQQKNSGQTIKVDIRFDNLIFPASLEITWKISLGVSITETYIKEANEQVRCTRIDPTSGKTKQYTKTQDFDHPGEWHQQR